jgi:hypothetical protein
MTACGLGGVSTVLSLTAAAAPRGSAQTQSAARSTRRVKGLTAVRLRIPWPRIHTSNDVQTWSAQMLTAARYCRMPRRVTALRGGWVRLAAKGFLTASGGQNRVLMAAAAALIEISSRATALPAGLDLCVRQACRSVCGTTIRAIMAVHVTAQAEAFTPAPTAMKVGKALRRVTSRYLTATGMRIHVITMELV